MTRPQKAVVAGMTAALLSVAGVAGAAGLGAFTTHVTRSHPVAQRTAAPRADRNLPERAVRNLPPLRHRFAPDVVLTFDRPVGAATLARLRGLGGRRAVTGAGSGSVIIRRD